MKLQEIFDALTYGELSTLAIGGSEAGTISEANWPRVLSSINLGLTALFKRFNLREGRLVLQMQPGQFTYPILSKYAVNNRASREDVRYLIDTVDAPFADDIFKIERVLTDDAYELPLNDPINEYSLSTPRLTTLRIPEDIVGQASNLPEDYQTENLELVYRANHPKIVIGLGFFDPTRVEVELPDSHLEALLLFVAARAHTPGGIQGEFNSGNNYLGKYEAACKDLENQGIQADTGRENNRFQRGGWV